MKKNLTRIITIAMVLTLTLSSALFIKAKTTDVALANEVSEKNKITVNGKGSIVVSPDMAYISIGVRTDNKDSKVAQQDNAKKMDAVIKAIKAAGVAEKDIKTVNYNMYPIMQYDNTGNSKGVDRYVVENTVKVTVRDINKVGSVLDKAVEQGANVSNGIQFTISNPQEVYNQALVLAVNEAKTKGNVIADSLKVKIGNPKSVVEQSSMYLPMVYGNYAMDTKESSYATPIQSGEMEVTAMVNVEFEY